MRHLLTLGFFGWLCWVIYLADTAQKFFFFELIRELPGGDKVGHCCLFGALAWLLNRSLQFRSFRLGPVALQLGAVLVMVFAVGEEFSQRFFPNRTFDWVDLLADGCGIGLVTLLQMGWRRRRTAAASGES